MRKLLGERPLTSAERAARHRARVKAAAGAELSAPVAPPVRPPGLVWPPDGTDPLPTRAEALALPLQAFPGWFVCIQCERCGDTRVVVNAGRSPWGRMPRGGCGMRAAAGSLPASNSAAASRASAATRCGGSCCGADNPYRAQHKCCAK